MLLKDSQLKKLIKKTQQTVDKKKKPAIIDTDKDTSSKIFKEMQKRPFS